MTTHADRVAWITAEAERAHTAAAAARTAGQWAEATRLQIAADLLAGLAAAARASGRLAEGTPHP
jgi:hypothetical protein